MCVCVCVLCVCVCVCWGLGGIGAGAAPLLGIIEKIGELTGKTKLKNAVLDVCLCWMYVCVGCMFVLDVCLCWM